ncbi:MAG: hypothetical protein ACOZE5_03490 [Verrucomicrobiota bacterium]
MKPACARFRSWWPGLLTALAGVACVRLAAPRLSGRAASVFVIAGHLLVPAGLAFLARRIHRAAGARAGEP